MKKKFESAEVRVIKFEASDLITTSQGQFPNGYKSEYDYWKDDPNEVAAINTINEYLKSWNKTINLLLTANGTVQKTGMRPSEAVTAANLNNCAS